METGKGVGWDITEHCFFPLLCVTWDKVFSNEIVIRLLEDGLHKGQSVYSECEENYLLNGDALPEWGR